MEKQYLTLVCPRKHKKEMEKEIERTGFNIKPGFPLCNRNSTGDVVYWIFELNVILDFKSNKQCELLNFQDKYCFGEGA